MKKLLAVIVIAMFLASLIPMNTTAASPTLKKIDGIKHPNPDNFKVRGDDIPGLDASSFYETATVKGIVPVLHPNSPWPVEVIDDYLDGTYLLDFNLFKAGVHCNIWIGLSTDVFSGYQDEWDVNLAGEADDEIYFAYPWSSTGGAFWGAPRLLPGYRDYIKGSQLLELINEFDNNIWQTEKDYFGDYNNRPGPDGNNRINILIFNIRDGLFWDPLTAPYFIEGYYWGYIAQTYDANVIHIDTYQWFRRQGPTPSGAAPLVVTYPPALCRPYEYEGTFAHEYQHLIHRDLNPNQLSWVNEGCSGLAQVICGYGFPISHIQSYLDEWWQTSLVLWQGNLADYGATFLFTYYMMQHYGGQPFIYDLTHCAPLVGIAGYNQVLQDNSITKDFDAIFQDWTITNYLDDDTIYGGIYGYAVLNIPSASTGGYSIQNRMAYWQKEYRKAFNWNPQLEGNVQIGYPYPYGTTLPYTANYVQFLQLGDHALSVAFKGPKTAGVSPHSGSYEWYSDGTAWSWFRLGQAFTVPSGGATLKFWSNYGIEQNWDYGYVEVHEIPGDQWYTLQGIKTISTIPNPQLNDNCPDPVEPAAYLTAGRWNAFTGSSGGWYQEQMSLASFANKQIELYFTYWTDGAVQEIGWYVDDIEIPELGIFHDMESGTNGWTANAGWTRTTGIYPMYFGVNFIQSKIVTPLSLDADNFGGPAVFPMINNAKVKYGPVTMIMTAQPGFELPFSTTYRFAYQKIPWVIWK